MKFILSLMTILLASGSVWSKLPPLETVKEVNLQTYMGTWYEYALIPNSFEKKCVADTKAQYQLLANHQVKVTNTCSLASGELNVALGNGKLVNATDTSKLLVSFVKLFGKWIYLFGGDYWIIDLDEHYEVAVVGSPSRKYAWILTRNPQIERATLAKIAEKLKAQKFDPCALRTTIQHGGNQSQQSICNLL